MAATIDGPPAAGGVDGDLGDFLGSVLGDFFDVHATFAGGDDEGALALAVHDDGEVVFALGGDVQAGNDENFIDLGAIGTGLLGDEGLAEEDVGESNGVGERADEADAAGFFTVFGELFTIAVELFALGVEDIAFAAAASVNLGFDDEAVDIRVLGFGIEGGEFFEFRFEAFGGLNGDAFSDGDAIGLEQAAGLVFVDNHVFTLSLCAWEKTTEDTAAQQWRYGEIKKIFRVEGRGP
jgi:hypothetical protein